jgi:two-component system, chemotaxis family, CheB/CheR fusion protein
MEMVTDNDQTTKKPVIVAIGASAGGIAALQTFFSALPERTGATFVVIVHLDPRSHSDLSSILAPRARMPIIQVTSREALLANHVYVIPPNRRLLITDDHISAAEFDEPRGHRAPIDLFFRSMAARHGDGYAVILTGAGSDGTIGVRAVKEAGGIILVHDPDEAEYPSMPRSAIATGLADFILPLRELAARLVELIRNKETVAIEATGLDEQLLVRILAHVRARTGHDFSKYKRGTVLRRLARRMQVSRTDDLRGYYDFLRDHAGESQALVGDLLISVTTFFRDPDAFEALKSKVIPQLFTAKQSTQTIRVWVPGCATGEEAYSIAMLLLEEAERHESGPLVQVFGSDLDARALAVARDGRFPVTIEADVSEERLRRFFVHEGDHYRVRQALRDLILFASHNLLSDPPFSRVDLISCRNLLIYLDRELQEQTIGTFHYSLNPDRFLLLGPSETADYPPDLFRTIDRNARIYQTTIHQADEPRLLPRLLGSVRGSEPLSSPGAPTGYGRAPRREPTLHAGALENAAPPSILIDQTLRVMHLSANAGRYLLHPAGRPSADIVDLVRPELKVELSAALRRFFEHGHPILTLPTPVELGGAPCPVQLWVKSAQRHDGEPQNAVVMFIEGAALHDMVAAGDQQHVDEHFVRQLKQELEFTQAQLRTMRDEYEAANEELRSSNEELQSINEESRTTSEELETSKEELQSINEELQTVNGELKLKLEAAARSDSDLQNVMMATDFGILFLDSRLRIKRFTPHVADLFSITMNDERRPITDFTHRLDYDALAKDAQMVVSNLAPIRREIYSRDNRWHDIQLRPYRTLDDKIDGVVVTFVDVTDLKHLQQRQQLLLRELSHRVKNTLAVVQAIAHQTERATPSAENFIEQFDGRISALGVAHDLLLESNWEGADLAELVRQQLNPYVAENSDRLRMEGEPILLPADVATPFGLILHELATNAAKHGSLSISGGSIHVSWTVNLGDNQRVLTFVWNENGGPPAPRPGRSGLGTRLIEKAIPNAIVYREFRPQRFACTIEVPL